MSDNNSKMFIPKGFQRMPGGSDVSWDDDKIRSQQIIEECIPDDTRSYFERRMELLGITKENNVIELWQSSTFDSEHKGANILVPFAIFTESFSGIDIRVYSLDRMRIRTTKELKRKSGNIEAVDKDYCITRLEEPRVKKDGTIQKYNLPKGYPALPFFPPRLVAKYDAAVAWKAANKGQKLPPDLRLGVLHMTEGFFKAFKADMHHIDVVGLPSITCMRDSETGELHTDIQTLILALEVERIVWLTDGDCRDISKDLTADKDLYTRPYNFFSTISKFYNLLSKFDHIEKYFAHINTDNLEGEPKGLDDVLCQFPDRTAEIAAEFCDFSKIAKGGAAVEGTYRVRLNIQDNINRIRKYFLINDVNEFYHHHRERSPKLKTLSLFTFHGTTYKYNEEEGKCEIEIPGSAADYFRADDDYYKLILVPDRFGLEKMRYHRRSKATIKDDHGDKIFKHIPKYETFCVVPDHINYQPVVKNCYNKYRPFIHEPEDGDCELTLEFIKHIFGEVPVPFTNKEGNKVHIPRWELGLDYIQLLYQRPQQILPILCLVSAERSTGKTKFIEWLGQIFSGNVAIVGNEDLQNSFNSHWADKLVIACDETKIDKDVVVEKVKSMSTGSEIMMNAKGRDQISMEFFGKFIFCSNNEDNFINIDKQEIRFWVISVPSVKKRNVHLVEEMKEEINSFLYFLNRRQMVTSHEERHWFNTELLQTEALENVKKNSKPSLEKRINAAIADLFENIPHDEITIPTKGILELLKGVELDWLKKTLKKMELKTEDQARLKYPKISFGTMKDGELGAVAEHGIVVEWIGFNSTHYKFKREDYTDVPGTASIADKSTNKDDLPF